MRNPIRRSRKIGKTQGGRVKAGKAVEKWSRAFSRGTWQKLSAECEGLRIVRENPSRNFFHPCSGEQILQVIARLPKRTTKHVHAVVLRRLPKTDERLLIEARRRYSCVVLNAFPKDLQMRWPGRPTASAVRHMKPWCDNWQKVDGEWILQWDVPVLRRYYLWHLLLHEIGHINQPHSSSRKRREDFAENFALEWARKLRQLD